MDFGNRLRALLSDRNISQKNFKELLLEQGKLLLKRRQGQR